MVRFKNRYLLCTIQVQYGEAKILPRVRRWDILSTVRSSIAVNFGEYAVGHTLAALAMKLWSPALKLCIIRSTRDEFQTVRDAVCLITELQGHSGLGQVHFTVIHVGGTIRSCQKAAAEYGRCAILQMRRAQKDTSMMQLSADAVTQELEAMET